MYPPERAHLSRNRGACPSVTSASVTRCALPQRISNAVMLNMIELDALRQSAARTFSIPYRGQAPRLTERCATRGRNCLQILMLVTLSVACPLSAAIANATPDERTCHGMSLHFYDYSYMTNQRLTSSSDPTAVFHYDSAYSVKCAYVPNGLLPDSAAARCLFSVCCYRTMEVGSEADIDLCGS